MTTASGLAWPTWRPRRPFRRGRRLARAVRAGSARGPRSLAHPAQLGSGRRPARRGRAHGVPSAQRGIYSGPGARAARLDGRTEWRPPRRASGPRVLDRAGAGQCHGRHATGRPGRAGWRARATRRAETPQGGHRAARDDYRQLLNNSELAPRAAELARAADAIGRRFDAQAWWRIAAQRDPVSRARSRGRTGAAGQGRDAGGGRRNARRPGGAASFTGRRQGRGTQQAQRTHVRR